MPNVPKATPTPPPPSLPQGKGGHKDTKPKANCRRCAHPAEAGQGSDELRPAAGDGIEFAQDNGIVNIAGVLYTKLCL